MLKLLLSSILSIFFVSQAGANSGFDCNAMRSEAQSLFSRMEQAFGYQQRLVFITENRDPDDPDRRVRLSDSHVEGSNEVRMADPCYLAETHKPSLEAYLFVLAHEYAHRIVNLSNDLCEAYYTTRFSDLSLENQDMFQRHNHMHANVDIMGLKILSHFGIDQRRAFIDLESHISRNGQMAYEFRDRFNNVRPRIPSTFNDFDLNQVGYLSGQSNLGTFMAREYPGSHFMNQLNSSFDRPLAGCLFAPDDMIPVPASGTLPPGTTVDSLRLDHYNANHQNNMIETTPPNNNVETSN